MKTVMVAVDGSESCRDPLHRAAQLAASMGAHLHVLHVAPISLTDLLHPEGLLGADRMLLVHVQQRLQKQGELILHDAKEQVHQPGLEITTELLLGHPGKGICEVAEAKHVECVVLGSRGRSKLKTLLLGSVSRFVLEHCAQPVLIVKPHPNSDVAAWQWS